jgi:hypothetical protein
MYNPSYLRSQRVKMNTTRAVAVVLAFLLAATVYAGAAADGSHDVLVFTSEVGTVAFPHKAHFNDMEIECRTCHHEVDARKLELPHPEYFADFWIDCQTCHHESDAPRPAQACRTCHHRTTDCADETLSSKVVVHESCWTCHESGTGVEASRGCPTCHVVAAQNPVGEETP